MYIDVEMYIQQITLINSKLDQYLQFKILPIWKRVNHIKYFAVLLTDGPNIWLESDRSLTGNHQATSWDN